MGTISLWLPESLHKQLHELAKQEGISINQFAATALAEKMSALMANEYLEECARRGTRQKFERAMTKVSSTTPPELQAKL